MPSIGLTNPKFPTNLRHGNGNAGQQPLQPTSQSLQKLDSAMEDAAGTVEGISIVMLVVIAVIILAVIVVNILGSVAASKFRKRPEASANDKRAALIWSLCGWFLFPPLSFVPMAMEHDAVREDRQHQLQQRGDRR